MDNVQQIFFPEGFYQVIQVKQKDLGELKNLEPYSIIQIVPDDGPPGLILTPIDDPHQVAYGECQPQLETGPVISDAGSHSTDQTVSPDCLESISPAIDKDLENHNQPLVRNKNFRSSVDPSKFLKIFKHENRKLTEGIFFRVKYGPNGSQERWINSGTAMKRPDLLIDYFKYLKENKSPRLATIYDRCPEFEALFPQV